MKINIKRPNFLSLIFVLSATLTFAGEQTLEERPIRALYLTGGYYHDYSEQAKIIPPSIDLYSSKKINWTIINQIEKQNKMESDFYKSPNWNKNFDVIVHNICFANLRDDDYVASIL